MSSWLDVALSTDSEELNGISNMHSLAHFGQTSRERKLWKYGFLVERWVGKKDQKV